MPKRTVHGTLADALGEVAAETFDLTITPVLNGGRRVGTVSPSGGAAGATYVPRERTVEIVDGETTFQILESDAVDDGVLYDLVQRGPMFDSTRVAGVYVPDAAEHPDPLYLWQLIQDYSGRTLAAAR